jgi:hypothetical protein
VKRAQIPFRIHSKTRNRPQYFAQMFIGPVFQQYLFLIPSVKQKLRRCLEQFPAAVTTSGHMDVTKNEKSPWQNMRCQRRRRLTLQAIWISSSSALQWNKAEYPFEGRLSPALCISSSIIFSHVLLHWSCYCGSAVRLPHLTTGRGPSCLVAILYRWSWRVLDGQYCKNGPEW